MNSTNIEISRQFAELASLLKNSDPNAAFKSNAYFSVSNSLKYIDDDLSKLSAKELMKYKCIGKSSAEKIIEFFKSPDHIIPKLKLLRTEPIKQEIIVEKKPKIKRSMLNPIFAVLNLNSHFGSYKIIDEKNMIILMSMNKIGLRRVCNMLRGVSIYIKYDGDKLIKGYCIRHPYTIQLEFIK